MEWCKGWRLGAGCWVCALERWAEREGDGFEQGGSRSEKDGESGNVGRKGC